MPWKLVLLHYPTSAALEPRHGRGRRSHFGPHPLRADECPVQSKSKSNAPTSDAGGVCLAMVGPVVVPCWKEGRWGCWASALPMLKKDERRGIEESFCSCGVGFSLSFVPKRWG